MGKFGVKPIDFTVVFGSDKTYTDGSGNVDGSFTLHGVGTFTQTFADMSFLGDGIEYFRPYIRGFFVLLLLFYNLDEFLSFIGLGRATRGFGSEKSNGRSKP